MRLDIPNTDPTPNPEQRLLMRERIERAMSGLTPQQRELAQMMAEGLTDAEIGARLGLTKHGARKRITTMRRTARATEQDQ